MAISGITFVAVAGLVKYLGPAMPAPQTAFLRYVLGLILLLPMFLKWRSLRLTNLQWQRAFWRGATHTLGVSLWFFAMARIPIADVSAMNYLTPVYVTIGAALFLKERFALRRMAAIGVALIGVLIVLRPGFREIDFGHLAMLLATMAFGASYLLAKCLTDELPAQTVVLLLSVSVTIALFPFAIIGWVAPSYVDLGILFLVACLATAGHYTMSLSFQATAISISQPVLFLQLVWAVILGILVFNEPLDLPVVLGGGLIFVAVSFITWRESVIQRHSTHQSISSTAE